MKNIPYVSFFRKLMICAVFGMGMGMGMVGLGAAGTAWAEESGYFSALPELPVPPLMREDADNAVRFDQPEGRIITLRALGPAKSGEIVEFYNKTMPALGWERHSVKSTDKRVEKTYYTREKEVLLMEINTLKDGSSRLNVLLRPR